MPWKKKRVMSKGIVMGFLLILVTSINMMVVPVDKAEIEGIESGKAELTMNASSGQILIYVNSTIFAALNTSLTQFNADLQAAGYQVVFRNWTATGPPVPPFLDAINLKNDINSYYTASTEGVILIGKMPYMMYDIGGYFPCDLYFMDLDGLWQDLNYGDGVLDSHTAGSGDRDPEIWVGRINPSTMTGINEITEINNYLARNHLYRIASLHRPDSALHFIDDSWSAWTNEWIGELVPAYMNQTVIATNSYTNDSRYELELTNSYEWVQLFVHSYYDNHVFYPIPTAGTTNWTEVRSINTQQLFYSLYACSACDIALMNNIGTEYLFSDNTLAVIGSSKVGGMLEPGKFYAPLGAGASLGVALARWFSECTLGSSGLNNPANSYGMIILGDPSLETKYGPITTAPDLYSLTNVGNQVNLQWSDTPDTAIYYIYRNTSLISDITLLAPIGSTSTINFMDTVPISNKTYYYVVVPGNSYANGSTSVCRNITISAAPGIPGFGFSMVFLSLIAVGAMAVLLDYLRRSKLPKLNHF